MDALLKSPVIRYPSLVRKQQAVAPSPATNPGPAAPPDSAHPATAPWTDSAEKEIQTEDIV